MGGFCHQYTALDVIPRNSNQKYGIIRLKFVLLIFQPTHFVVYLIRPFFFDYLVYGSAEPIFHELEEEKN